MQKMEILGLDKFQGKNILPGFYVNTLSDHLKTSHKHIEKPHKHDFYATMIFTVGSGSHTIDFRKYLVTPGRVFLMSPGQVHHWELSAGADGFIFFHTKEFYELRFSDEKLADYTFFSQVQNLDSIDIPTPLLNGFTSHFTSMAMADFDDMKAKRHFMISHINQVYLEIEKLVSGKKMMSTANGYWPKFNRFSELLEQDFRTEKSPERYAGRMNMTAKHLNRINRETVGKTTSEIILERVVLEAKRKLTHSDANFNEIASSLGYDDYAYFSKLFKRKTGSTPSAFQKSSK